MTTTQIRELKVNPNPKFYYVTKNACGWFAVGDGLETLEAALALAKTVKAEGFDVRVIDWRTGKPVKQWKGVRR